MGRGHVPNRILEIFKSGGEGSLQSNFFLLFSHQRPPENNEGGGVQYMEDQGLRTMVGVMITLLS